MQRFFLQSSSAYGWRTGVCEDGSQLLVGRLADRAILVRFGRDGLLNEVEVRDADGEDGDIAAWFGQFCAAEHAIQVAEFDLPEVAVALNSMPKRYRAFLGDVADYDPSERSHFAVLINDWRETDHFAFQWGDEYWCNHDGIVLHHEA